MPPPNLRERILGAAKARVRKLESKALGFDVWARPLTVGGSLAVMSHGTIPTENPTPEDMARGVEQAISLMIDCLCDETGERIFSADDAIALRSLPQDALAELGQALSPELEATTADAAGK